MSDVVAIHSVELEYKPESTVVHFLAVVEDMVRVRAQTLLDPEEYAPAECSGSVELEEGESVPNSPNGLLRLARSVDDWEVLADW
jgi:hypothetical protein